MLQSLGRVDWVPRWKVWRVIWYEGLKDITIGEFLTKAGAENKLRELVDNQH